MLFILPSFQAFSNKYNKLSTKWLQAESFSNEESISSSFSPTKGFDDINASDTAFKSLSNSFLASSPLPFSKKKESKDGLGIYKSFALKGHDYEESSFNLYLDWNGVTVLFYAVMMTIGLGMNDEESLILVIYLIPIVLSSIFCFIATKSLNKDNKKTYVGVCNALLCGLVEESSI